MVTPRALSLMDGLDTSQPVSLMVSWVPIAADAGAATVTTTVVDSPAASVTEVIVAPAVFFSCAAQPVFEVAERLTLFEVALLLETV